MSINFLFFLDLVWQVGAEPNRNGFPGSSNEHRVLYVSSGFCPFPGPNHDDRVLLYMATIILPTSKIIILDDDELFPRTIYMTIIILVRYYILVIFAAPVIDSIFAHSVCIGAQHSRWNDVSTSGHYDTLFFSIFISHSIRYISIYMHDTVLYRSCIRASGRTLRGSG